MTQIKYMLIPQLGERINAPGSDGANGSAGSDSTFQILPPLIDNEQARKNFVSSPVWVQPIESLWARPAQTPYDELFGMAGAAGPHLYRNSIKFQTWLCITHIVFFGSQIVTRDLNAIFLSGTTASVGNPEYVTLELITYGSFVLLSLIQLLFVTPRGFWNLCLVVSAEDGASEELLTESIPAESLDRAVVVAASAARTGK